jgi:hypothetical protein
MLGALHDVSELLRAWGVLLEYNRLCCVSERVEFLILASTLSCEAQSSVREIYVLVVPETCSVGCRDLTPRLKHPTCGG